jgi:hypothetical protein
VVVAEMDWAGPRRRKKGRSEQASGEASGPARLKGPAGRTGERGGRKEILLFQI